MYPLFRSLLFRLDPERAHALTVSLMGMAGKLSPLRAVLSAWYAAPPKPVSAFGLDFGNPLGLAAGYDKDGLAWRGLAALGFGHIEVGTVTLQPQAGNPRPRLFRLAEDEALINRMGFPGQGAAALAGRLKGARPAGLVLGVNLGKNKDTPLEAAAQEYLELAKRFAPLADYLAINVSSPNTIGLRRLQARQALDELLQTLCAERGSLLSRLGKPVALLVKLAPDLNEGELADALDVIREKRIDGVIATNTSLSRQGVTSDRAQEIGGLSGAPLKARSTQMIAQIHRLTKGLLPIIGAGGVASVEDAREKLQAGASLVQVYTGLVYKGPGLVKEILRNL